MKINTLVMFSLLYATTISACGSYTWLNNGQIYTASGIYFGDTVNCIIQK
jgi:hypothetical protein